MNPMIRFLLKFIVVPITVYIFGFVILVVITVPITDSIGVIAFYFLGFPTLVICWWGIKLSQWMYDKYQWTIPSFFITRVSLGFASFGLGLSIAVSTVESNSDFALVTFLAGTSGAAWLIFTGLMQSVSKRSDLNYTFSPIRYNMQDRVLGKQDNRLHVPESKDYQVIEANSRNFEDKYKASKTTINLASASPGYIYLVKAITPDNYYKIGLSKNPVKRIQTMGVKLPFPVTVLHLIPTNHARQAEKILHSKYAKNRVNGEWFEFSEDEVDEIQSLTQLYIPDVEMIWPDKSDIGRLQ